MGDWKHGLFGCFDNFGLCIYTFFCPCIIFGKVAETVGDNCMLCGFSLFVPVANIVGQFMVRGKVRAAKRIEGSSTNDCLMILCCWFCSLVQMVQETEGDPPAIGASMSRE